LPTEAEWEYACRAGRTGDENENWGLLGWHSQNSKNRTHPVGEKQPNAWGLYDIHGNIWEWCSDWYGSYSSETAVDPSGPSSGSGHVLRGGSWRQNLGHCRPASRLNDRLPLGATGFSSWVGFRLVRDMRAIS